jgi:hypothetical protein
VTIYADDLRQVKLEKVEGRRDVHLKPGLPVRVILRGEGRPPEPPFFLQPVLKFQQDGYLDCGWNSRPFDAAGETVVLASAPGRYMVQVGVGRGRFTRSTVWVDIQPPQIVAIHDLPGEQEVEVRLDKAAIEKALKAYTD